jgi:hypothetical protein
VSRASLARAASLGHQVNYLARLLAHALRERSSRLGSCQVIATIIDNIEKAGRRTDKKSNRVRTAAER